MGKIAQRLIERLGDQWYRKALFDLFGFGQKTMVELPAETAGLLPTPGKLHPNGKPEWSVPTPYSLAMGHNILVNSIQLAKAYAIIANGGLSVQPHLIRKIVKGKQVLIDNTRYRATERVLSAQASAALVRALKFVTKEGGNSRRADIPGYTEAGKSGTAEKIVDGVYSKEHHVSSFAGFAPATSPRFVLIVSIDDPEKKYIPGVGPQQKGGVCAAPIFREIGLKTLQYLGVELDDPFGYPVGDKRRDPKRADYVNESAQIKELYQRWNGGT
jgi:cell division protein FtsI (penicillin-binding protein 3)